MPLARKKSAHDLPTSMLVRPGCTGGVEPGQPRSTSCRRVWLRVFPQATRSPRATRPDVASCMQLENTSSGELQQRHFTVDRLSKQGWIRCRSGDGFAPQHCRSYTSGTRVTRRHIPRSSSGKRDSPPCRFCRETDEVTQQPPRFDHRTSSLAAPTACTIHGTRRSPAALKGRFSAASAFGLRRPAPCECAFTLRNRCALGRPGLRRISPNAGSPSNYSQENFSVYVKLTGAVAF